MICNKCGTPILPGENSCRGCGTVGDYSEKKYVKRFEKIEIIDFVEPEVIDFTAGEDEVSISSSVKNEENLVNDNSSISESNSSNNDLPSLVATPITEAPLEATGMLKKIEVPKENTVIETTKMPENPLVNDEPSSVSSSTSYVVTSPETRKEDDSEEIITEETKDDDNSNKKEKGSKDLIGAGRLLGLIMILILLFLSAILNVYLLISNSNNKVAEEPENSISQKMQTIYLNQYKLETPNNWIAITSKDSNYIVLMDNTEQWAVSINVKEGLEAKSFTENKDKIIESFGKSKYLFTSDYVADTIDDSFHVFKGKYYNYISYVITRTLNSSTIAISDLKFKGEVDEDIYNAVVSSLKTISKIDVDSIYSNNFEFGDISTILSENLKQVSTGD